ncbi:peroxiredoxin family protein [Thalassotalea marina]|uniref:Thioredoxin domain-containing protein n=1 Tax=Thalassotalea marina TaxID=1673741 RepID=A0A919EPU9_9GAMM|nr:redoxin domain-containing protein [Thalassotalea marina]GHG05432.1 hypothetical protein GCM10017161_38800 [Thalassotalea marina]
MKTISLIATLVLLCLQFNVLANDKIFERIEFKQDVFGATHHIAASAGTKPVILVFFEPYTGYGLAQANTLYADFNDDFTFYGIAPAMNSTADIVANAAQQHQVTFGVFFDENNVISRQLKAWQHPSFIVFDSEGKQLSGALMSVNEITQFIKTLRK